MSIDDHRADASSIEATHRVRDACLCLAAQRTARALARRFDAAFRPLGLTSGQFSLLNGLNRRDPPTIAELARLLAMDRSTVTAALKPLARRGLVVVEENPADRRERRLLLTAAGRERLGEAIPVWTSTHAALERGRDARDLDRLRRDLATLSAAE